MINKLRLCKMTILNPSVSGCCLLAVSVLTVLAGPVTYLDQEDLSSSNFTCCDGHCHDKTNFVNYNRYLVLAPDVLYVGAMNYLYQLNKNDLTCTKNRSLPADEETKRRCRLQGKTDVPDCQNHIRVIMENNNRSQLFVCGTGAYFPTKYSLNRITMQFMQNQANFTETESSGRGNGICPFDPNDNATSLYTNTGNLGNGSAMYFGTYSDFLKNNPVFFRPKFVGTDGIEHTDKSTDQDDSKWLNVPQFAGTFDEGNQVFTFFREIALEFPDPLVKKTYARVAKVCKQDLGGGYMNKKKWLSYQKARLNCSLPGRDPYYFDDLYDIYKSGDQYFGLFFKHGADLNSSAVCVFSKARIEESFNGKFKYKDGDMWKTVPDNLNPNPRLDNCTAHDTNPGIFENRVSEYQLMDKNVDMEYEGPIFYKRGVQFMKIVVGPEFNKSRNIYLASDKGSVHDIFMKTFTSGKPKCTENAVYRPLKKDAPIWDMKLESSTLYLGTDHEVVKFDLTKTCTKMVHCDACVYNTLCAYCNNTCDVSSCTGTGNPRADHNDVHQTESLVGVLIKKAIIKDINNSTVPITQPAFEGAYSTLQIKSQNVRFTGVTWFKEASTTNGRKKRSQADADTVVEDPTRTATSESGDLIIRNLTIKDSGIYIAKSADDGRILEKIRLNVQTSTDKEDMVEVWKQAFNDWSSSFRKWQDCSSNYLETCQATRSP
ncbi:semaphorin-2A-like [Dreissena polymorpha]|uniref:semaphorin-2A-like n=1 Tax=Dreissena polymorpha TaxID=45954 RepID=UPI002264E083|nr:semaphorin-2A-like [Dreissena polymorpha]